tara:strand:+ start:137062 stop:137202 length:141 start_codon:yes stop_codon:yes gene_type:complete
MFAQVEQSWRRAVSCLLKLSKATADVQEVKKQEKPESSNLRPDHSK